MADAPMTPTTLAETILRDVPRMKRHLRGPNFLPEGAVLAALTAALDPALTERAGEVVERLRGRPDAIEDVDRLRDEAADLITALLAQNAAQAAQIAGLTKERDEWRKLESAAQGLSGVLNQHETKGPLPDTALMFCWLAAQNVRAVLRGYMLEKTE